MKTLAEIISSRPIKGISDYFSLNREIEKVMENNEFENEKHMNIALIASSTINGIKETLRVQCGEFGVLANFFVGGYNQYAQEILNPQSDLYKFNPDLVIIFVDTRSIAGDFFFMPYAMSHDDRRSWANETVDEIAALAFTVAGRCPAKVVLHNFEVPVYSPMGLVENKQEFGFIESIEMVNRDLRDRFKKNNQVFLYDFNSFCSQIGKQNVFDYKMYYLGDIKLTPQYIPHLCRAYTGYVKALASLTKKCIVLDLDNTLWGGVVGEDGLEGIHLGPTPEGRPFLEFQKYLLSLFQRGVILAINSKNNPEDALDVLQNHPHMILREKHFAAMQINWDDKITNMKALAEEINVGLDSFVFFDDDCVNREMVREFLPEVTVVDMPKDISLYAKTLMDLDSFYTLSITEEDKKKGRMYADEKKRRTLAHSQIDLAKYLQQLRVIVTIEEVKKSTIPRVSQLTRKTNQFNMTTRRYTEEAIAEFAESNEYCLVSVHVSDKFGDSGLTGVAIVEKESKGIWRIDAFLLSCRVIGRKVEESLLAHIINNAKNEGAHLLRGEFVSSGKNIPAEGFYKKSGFVKAQASESVEIWEYDLSNDYPFPDSISVKIVQN